jgi:hypothetical protein
VPPGPGHSHKTIRFLKMCGLLFALVPQASNTPLGQKTIPGCPWLTSSSGQVFTDRGRKLTISGPSALPSLFGARFTYMPLLGGRRFAGHRLRYLVPPGPCRNQPGTDQLGAGPAVSGWFPVGSGIGPEGPNSVQFIDRWTVSRRPSSRRPYEGVGSNGIR